MKSIKIYDDFASLFNIIFSEFYIKIVKSLVDFALKYDQFCRKFEIDECEAMFTT